ncbi:g9266 [Coccomyxa elongata]
MPYCDPDQMIVADEKGQIKTRSSCPNQSCEQKGSHNISHFAGPYFLQYYLRNSKYYTSNINSADAVLVYDYCYIQWLIASTHADEKNFPTEQVLNGYRALSRLRRFVKHMGRDFVFFEAHPLSGAYISDRFCDNFGRSLHLVVEGAQRYMCPAVEDNRDFLVVPYSSPEFVEDIVTGEAHRDIDIFFQGHCSDHLLALSIRKFTIEYLEGLHLPSVQASCDKSNTHKDLRDLLRRSKFCLVIAGETASTRRLTDAMLAGCIPVFLGPPWHSLPLAQWVDYASFAIFIELAGIRDMDIATPAVPFSEPPLDKSAKSVYQHNWWILDADISIVTRTIGSVSEIYPLLKAVPAKEVAQRQANLKKYESYFRYRRTPAEEADPSIRKQTATDAILSAICAHVDRAAARPALHRKESVLSMITGLFGRSGSAS